MLAFLSVGLLVHRTATDRNISRTTKWIAMKGATDVHSPHRMNAAGFGDSCSTASRRPEIFLWLLGKNLTTTGWIEEFY